MQADGGLPRMDDSSHLPDVDPHDALRMSYVDAAQAAMAAAREEDWDLAEAVMAFGLAVRAGGDDNPRADCDYCCWLGFCAAAYSLPLARMTA